MKHRLAFIACLVAIAAPTQAQIFRCAASSGAVSYQEMPCPASAQSRTMDISAIDYPEVNRAERDRLLQREAALDARLLKRAEIDAAERIARDDRIARERELQALRQAQAHREAAPSMAVVVIGMPAVPRRHFHRRPSRGL